MAKNKKDPILIRALSYVAKIDWRALLLILTALGGAGGAVWNKVEGYIDRLQNAKTQTVTYELLAQRIDELFDRMDALETKCDPKTAMLKRKDELENPKIETLIERKFQKSRLPAFDVLQRAAPDELAPLMLNVTKY